MLTVGTRFTISPSQTGLVLSYILSVQQAFVFLTSFTTRAYLIILSSHSFGWLVRQSAEVENNMNSVERIVHYATQIEQEAPDELSNQKPPSTWPLNGRVELRDVVLNYRPELPPVLKGMLISKY